MSNANHIDINQHMLDTTIPHLEHDYPIPTIKMAVEATMNPHLKAMRDLLKDETTYIRKSIEGQNTLIANIQLSLATFSKSYFDTLDRLHDTINETNLLKHSKASTEQYQQMQIEYNARIDMYENQLASLTTILSSTILLMREMSMELSRVADIFVSLDQTYITSNPDVPNEVKDGYKQVVSALELLEKKASDYASDLPLSPY